MQLISELTIDFLRHCLRRVAVASVIMAVLGAVVACSSPDEPAVTTDPAYTPSVYLSLNVGIEESCKTSVLSRGITEGYYFEEPLRPNEQLNNLHVFITDNDIVEAMREVRYNRFGQIIGNDNLTFKLTPGNKRIYLLGNTSSLPAGIHSIIESIHIGDQMPVGDLNSAILSRSITEPFFTPDQDIPMTETFDISLVLESPDKPTYVRADMFVTRIAVKYTILCPDDVTGLSVRLPALATKQYFMPNGVVYDPDKYRPGEKINGIEGRNIISFLSPASDSDLSEYTIALTGKTLVNAVNPDGSTSSAKTYRYDPIYMMETPGSVFRISACVDHGLTDDNGNDIGGQWFDYRTLPNLPLLPRNTHVVVSLSAKYGFKCNVDLVPYRGCILEPFFGITRD